MSLAWAQPDAPTPATQHSEWIVEWKSPHWWRWRRRRLPLPAAPELIVEIEPSLSFLMVRVQAVAGRRTSEWSPIGRATAGQLVKTTVSVLNVDGAIAVHLGLLVRSDSEIRKMSCEGLPTAAGVAHESSAAKQEVEAHHQPVSVRLRVESTCITSTQPTEPVHVVALVQPYRIPWTPPTPCATEVLVSLSTEETTPNAQSRREGQRYSMPSSSDSDHLSDAMLAFIAPTVDPITTLGKSALVDGTIAGAVDGLRLQTGRSGVRVRVSLAMVTRSGSASMSVPRVGGPIDSAMMPRVKSGAALMGLVNGLVGGMVGGVVGGVSGLRDGVVDGVVSLGELATTAASWSIDIAHVWSHTLSAGGRRDVIREVEAARGPLPPPPPPASADACIACLRAASAAPIEAAQQTTSLHPSTASASASARPLPDGIGSIDERQLTARETARFTMRRRRHHCRHCGGSFCAEHLRWRRRLDHKFSGIGPAAQRVCEGCARMLAREEHENRLAVRLLRCTDFTAGQLEAYEEVLDDTLAAKARRAGELTLLAAKKLPLSAKLHATVVGLDNARKYGRLGLAGVLLREDLLRMLVTLKAVGGDAITRRPIHELTGALFYLMARRREERGCDPTHEEASHKTCPTASEAEIADISEWAPIALRVAYERTLVDMQRHARLHGYALLFAELQDAHSRGAHLPAFSFLACARRRRIVLAIRGTQDLSDVLTDSYAHGQPFCGGWAHAGMARTARWLEIQLGPCILHFAEVFGYEVVLVGHSLGAGVAALLAALLRPRIQRLRCIGFATPSVASGEMLLTLMRSCCVSVVLRNDAIPRATLESVSRLFDELAAFTDWKEELQADWQGVVSRAKTLWAPHLRGPPPGVEASRRRQVESNAASGDAGKVSHAVSIVGDASTVAHVAPPAPPSQPFMQTALAWSSSQIDVLPGMETRTADARVDLVQSQVSERGVAAFPVLRSEPGQSVLDTENGAGLGSERGSTYEMEGSEAPGAVEVGSEESAQLLRTSVVDEEDQTYVLDLELLTESSELPANEDAPITSPTDVRGGASVPTLRIPGRVLHIFTVHGVFRACWVPNDFAPLSSIVLAPHMINDHRGKSYLAALRAIKASAVAIAHPPPWVPFCEAPSVCAVCAAAFSWQSTCRSAAQEVCARHHCRACGQVVCAACSTHAACLPEYGIIDPARVCDACFWKL